MKNWEFSINRLQKLLVALKEQDNHVEMIINSNNMLYLPHCISSYEGTY